MEFGADQLDLHFADGMKVDKISGDGNGRLVSNAQTMRTTVTGAASDLDFDTSGKDSMLTAAVATGGGVAEAVPLPEAGRRDGGDQDPAQRHDSSEDEKRRAATSTSVETDGAATLDFLPNRPGQPKRLVKGDQIWITYGDDNRIQSFRSINASTRTDKPRGAEQTGSAAGIHGEQGDAGDLRPQDQRPGAPGPEDRFRLRRRRPPCAGRSRDARAG